MNLVILNPNSTASMTGAFAGAARRAALASTGISAKPSETLGLPVIHNVVADVRPALCPYGPKPGNLEGRVVRRSTLQVG